MLETAGTKLPQSPQPRPGVHRAQRYLESVLTAIGAARAGQRGKWQCPTHGRVGEHTVALGVGTRSDGTGAWVHCHAGCTAIDVLRSVKLTPAHLRTPPPVSPERHVDAQRIRKGFPAPKAGSSVGPRAHGFRHECFHPYGDGFRKERLRHPATGAKTLMWECRNPAGEWVPGLLGLREADLPLYREKDVLMGIAMGETVLLVESESSVDSLVGWYACTWAGGASSPPAGTLQRVLGEHERVVIVGDNDEAGRSCVGQLARTLPRAHVLLSEVDGEDARDLHARVGEAHFTDLVTALVDLGAIGCPPEAARRQGT